MVEIPYKGCTTHFGTTLMLHRPYHVLLSARINAVLINDHVLR